MKRLCVLLNRISVFVLILTVYACNSPQTQIHQDVLWYHQPAKIWEEALPLGNGNLGAMVFGNPKKEHIQLNEDSMWPADLNWEHPPGTKADIETIRQLLFEEKNDIADKLIVEKFSAKQVVRSHQTMGDLFIDLNHDTITDYKRQLNLNKAIATVSYKTNGSTVNEKVFVSHPDKAIIIEYKTTASSGLNGKIYLSRPMDKGHPTVVVTATNANTLVMKGEVTQHGGVYNSKPAPIPSGVKFETQIKVDIDGGEIANGADYLELKGAKTARFYLVCNTSYYKKDYIAANKKQLKTIYGKSISELEKRHVDDHEKWYNSMQFSLNHYQKDSIATDKRIMAMKQGGEDLGLEELLFKYGRYLLIGSSRLGSNPANLQGLWNKEIQAPWNSDYHLNINLQMNYWPANLTNLDTLNIPLFNYIDKLVEKGKETALKNFGCKGAFIAHASDLWGSSWMRAEQPYWGSSMGAGGWMMQHYWQHYLFTKDETFLKQRALPAMEQVAQFYSDWLIKDPRDGYLISAPSTSPENSFINNKGKSVALCLGSAMDQQVISEVFTNYISGCEVLNLKSPFLDKVKRQLSQMRPGFIIGENGRVLEWDRPYKEVEPGHRHMSHLYGFHPGTSVTKSQTPKVFDAVKKTLKYRLDNGGAGTGWSRAWLINCSARLQDGNMAHEHIKLLFKKSIFINLFDAHPPFQIDGNFGYTAGVAEMLLQSHESNVVHILPALPDAWSKGSVKRLKARGGIEVSFSWEKNKLISAALKANKAVKTIIRYKNKEIPLNLKADETYVYQPEK